MEDNETLTLFERLSYLPPEIIHKIINLLPLNSLIFCYECPYESIKQNLQNIRYVNTNGVLSQMDVQTCFKSLNVNYIRELNFDNFYTSQPSLLCKTITRCKKLQVLSVQNTTLNDEHVARIFENLPHIETFSWTVNLHESGKRRSFANYQWPIKNLSLNVMNEPSYAFVSLKFLKCFQLLENLELQLRIRRALISSEERPLLEVDHLKSLQIKCIIISYADKPSIISAMFLIATCLQLKKTKTPLQSVWLEANNQEIICDLCEIQSDNLETSAFVLPSDFLNCQLRSSSNSHIVSIAELGFQTTKSPYILKFLSYRVNHKCITAIYATNISCTLQKTIIDNSQLTNIREKLTILDIHNFHCVDGCLTTIQEFKNLRYLNLPACAFKSSESELDTPTAVRNVVLNCKNVNSFHVSECTYCSKHNMKTNLTEQDISSIHMWRELRMLSIVNVKYQGSWVFLGSIVENCQFLKSIELVKFGISISPIITILQNAKVLSSIKIIHPLFLADNPSVWDNISKIQTLEQICFSIRVQARMDYMPIVKSVMKLPKLKALHFVNILQNPIDNFEKHMRTKLSAKNLDLAFESVNNNCCRCLCLEKSFLDIVKEQRYFV